MIKKLFIWGFIILTCLCFTIPVQAADKPLPYTISAPKVVYKRSKHLVELHWRQDYRTLVVVYKLSEDRKAFDDCGWLGDNYKAQYCKVLFSRRGLKGNIVVKDRDYKFGDEYYILQYVYLTHNGAYGPFKP